MNALPDMAAYRLQNTEDALFPECWALYEASFPAVERRTLACQRAAMEEQGQGSAAPFHCLRLAVDGVFAGIAFYWQAEEFIYVEHLAICPERRGQGIGHLALEYICAQGLPVILEIEPVADATTERRWQFYRSAGFHRLPYKHLQPLYRRGDAPLRLELLSYPHAMSVCEYFAYEAYMNTLVAHYTEERLFNA